jgi:hypothetical protein
MTSSTIRKKDWTVDQLRLELADLPGNASIVGLRVVTVHHDPKTKVQTLTLSSEPINKSDGWGMEQSS